MRPPRQERIIIDRAATIEKYLKRLGRRVELVKDGETTVVYAVIEQTWKRNKSRFEKNSSEIGRYYKAYYIYYGPASCNILDYTEDDYAQIDGVKYSFVQTEAFKVGGKVQYYRGVLKKEQGEEGYEFE